MAFLNWILCPGDFDLYRHVSCKTQIKTASLKNSPKKMIYECTFQEPLYLLSFPLFVHAITLIGLGKVFLKQENSNHYCWLGKLTIISFLKLNIFTHNIRFTYKSLEKVISFFDLIITLMEQKMKTILHVKSYDRPQYLLTPRRY